MIPSKIKFVFLVMAMLLAGCRVTAVPRQTEAREPVDRSGTSTLTTSPVMPSSPTFTPTIQSTITRRPTTTRTPTPIPSATPTPPFRPLPIQGQALTITPAFLTPTGAPKPNVAWTPLAAPEGQSYRLKEWNSDEALAMLRAANDFAYDVDFPSAGSFRQNFSAAQGAVNLAAREALLRFPDFPEPEQVTWLAASSGAFLNQGSADAWLSPDELLSSAPLDNWIAEEIESRLNQGLLDPTDLGSGLLLLGFDAFPGNINEYETEGRIYGAEGAPSAPPVMNLFGDGRPVYLWKIIQHTDPYYGLHLALAQKADGFFQVEKVRGGWRFPYAGGQWLEVQELTGDDQPELVIRINDCEGTCNIIQAAVYRWQEGRFVDISHGNLGRDQWIREPGISWEYAALDKNGVKDIIVTRSYAFNPARYTQLHWNGEWLEVARRWMDISDDPLRAYQYAREMGNTAEMAEALQSLLKRPPNGEVVSFPDFLNFQLAMVESQSSHVQEARSILQSIVDAPHDPEKTLMSEAAAIFLKTYQEDADLYRSCQAALQAMAPKFNNPQFQDSLSMLDSDVMSTGLCSLRPAFRLLVSRLDLETEDLPAALRRAGVLVRSSSSLDLDGDGLLDWLLILEASGSRQSVDAWVLLASPQGYQAVPVLYFEPEWDYFPTIDAIHLVRVEPVLLPGSQQAGVILQTGNMLRVLRVHRKGTTAEVEVLLGPQEIFSSDVVVDHFEIHPAEAELWVFNTTEGYRLWDIYAWREDAGAFTYIDPIERLIFEHNQPQKAIQAIQAELAHLDKEDSHYETLASRLYYLMGLSYELSGNTGAAARTYLQIWRDFPSSAYAHLAKARLVATTP